MSIELTNWAGNFTYGADAVHYPTSVADVQELVARLTRAKALGTRHSFNDVADCPGALVSLTKMAPDITIDEDAMTASVTGGTPYGVLAAGLQSQGYALHNMGSLPHISIAGATATGTHGSGDRNGILSTAVSAVELVKADGSLVTVDRASPDLQALAVGVGAFGIITRLVLDIQPTYMVRQDVYRDASWDIVLDGFDEVMSSAYSVSLMADFGSPMIRELWQKTRVESTAEGHHQPEPVPQTLHGGTWYDDTEESTEHSLHVRAGVVGPWSERLPHFRLDAPPSVGGDELQSEYFVDRRHAVDALRALRSLGERIAPHLHGAEIRTAASDDLWLAPPTSATASASGSPGANIPSRSWPCFRRSRPRSRRTNRGRTGGNCSCSATRTWRDASPDCRTSANWRRPTIQKVSSRTRSSNESAVTPALVDTADRRERGHSPSARRASSRFSDNHREYSPGGILVSAFLYLKKALWPAAMCRSTSWKNHR